MSSKAKSISWDSPLKCKISPEPKIRNPGYVYCKNHWFYWLQEGENKTLTLQSRWVQCMYVFRFLIWPEMKPYSGLKPATTLIFLSFDSRELTLSADSEWDVSVSVPILKRQYAQFRPSLLLGFHVARLSRTDILYTDGPSCKLLYW